MPNNTLQDSPSWVIVDKSTGRAIAETFRVNVALAINTLKYRVVPIEQYLQEFNQAVQS